MRLAILRQCTPLCPTLSSVSRDSGGVCQQALPRGNTTKKPGTGDPLHTQEPVTVASFRTWRGWRECVARDRCLTFNVSIPEFQPYSVSQTCTRLVLPPGSKF